MSGMMQYSIDSEARRNATLAVAGVSIVLAILFNLVLLPWLGNRVEALVGTEMVTVFVAVGLVSFGGIGTFAFFGLLWTAFDKWLWYKKPFRCLHGIPNLNGKWKGELVSSFKDDQGCNARCSMELVVTQTFSKIQCESHFQHSGASSSVVGIYGCNSETRSCFLEYSYGNEAGSRSIEDQSWENEHCGFSRVRCTADEMQGRYFTNRASGTQGTFSLHRESVF